MHSDDFTSSTNSSAEDIELLAYLLEDEGIDTDLESLIPRRDPGVSIPLSVAQERMWVLDQWNPGNPAYNLLFAAQITGQLQVDVFAQSLNEIVRRHEVLRTVFHVHDGQPRQIVLPVLTLPLTVIDLSALTAADQIAARQQQIAQWRVHRFDLSAGPLLSVALLRFSASDHLFLITIHHIVFDGWSVALLLRELALLYPALLHGQPVPLAPLPIQYGDFALWQRQWLQGAVLEQQLAYWQRQLGGTLPSLDLPTDYPRPPALTYAGAARTRQLPPTLLHALHRLSQAEDATLFMTVLTAFQVLLSRYSGQTDILVGSPIANRAFGTTEHLLGLFLNTLVLRADLSAAPSFRRLLQQVRDTTLDAYAHQNVPFEQLIEALRLPRDPSRTPLFQVMLILQNTPVTTLDQRDLRVDYERIQHDGAKFDLTLSLNETTAGLSITAEYKTDLFQPATIDQLLGHYQTLLEAIVADADLPITRLPLLTAVEQRQLLAYNAAPAAAVDPACIHQHIESQAQRTPDAPALVYTTDTGAQQQMSYHELNRRANQLAQYLRGLGVQPEERIGLCIERSAELVIGILGILKAGGAYVPLDPTYPSERLQFMVEDAGVRWLLTRQTLPPPELPAPAEGHAEAVLSWFRGTVVDLLSDWTQISQQPASNPAAEIGPRQLAYVIYTSGSTGQPKGVVVEHQSLVNYTTAARAHYGITAADRVLQFASINFDASAEEIYTALTSGAALVLRTEQMIETIDSFLSLCDIWRISVVSLPTAYWHELVARLVADRQSLPPTLRLVILGGERALPDRVALWRQHVGAQVQLINSYGPTEATVVATVFPIPPHASEDERVEIPIGRPLHNLTAQVLDRHLEPVPIGVAGELWLGGLGLARGYLNRPDLTAEKFAPDPFSQQPGARIYRSGDLARRLPDGTLEFLGRVDQQVKIRGYRVEVGEIEAALRLYPAVTAAVVEVRADQLVAYIVAQPGYKPKPSELRAFLLLTLPHYMIPGAFVSLERLPLQTSGKVDRRALPAPERVRPELESNFAAPRSSTEQQVAALWSSVLKLEQIGIYDNFFELGGHSLLATQLLARLRSTFQVELPLRHLFASPTVASMAEMIDTLQWMAQGVTTPDTDTDDDVEEGEL